MVEPWKIKRVIAQSLLILNSYRHWTGEDLIPLEGGDSERAQALFEAPVVVVSHGMEMDPILNYGNRKALDLWEMTWDSFIHTPSRLTAEIINREERTELLKEVSEKGYSLKYQGIRISSTGRRFRMENARVWNLVNESEEYCGQAATFDRWTYV